MRRGHCDGHRAGVYRGGNTFALRGGGRRVIRLSCAGLAFVLMFGFAGVVAQPADPAGQPAAPTQDDSNAKVKSELAAAREQQRTTAATRQQIQAIRAALRARLAALHR